MWCLTRLVKGVFKKQTWEQTSLNTEVGLRIHISKIEQLNRNQKSVKPMPLSDPRGRNK